MKRNVILTMTFLLSILFTEASLMATTQGPIIGSDCESSEIIISNFKEGC
jgi:hypothetical protein